MADDEQPPANVTPIRPAEPRPGRGQGQQENAAVTANRALELRMAGATYAQIAEALNLGNKGRAYGAVQAALRAENESIAGLREEYRDLQLQRIERLTRAHWPNAVAGDMEASKYVLSLMDREARLLGLDAPKQIQLSGQILQAADDALLRLREVVLGEVIDTATDDDSEHG